MKVAVEICAGGRQAACNARAGGADRIELCDRLDIGGITPAMEDVEYSVKQLGLRTHVLIRPRGGDFCYNEQEYAHIMQHIEWCRKAGAQAVVVGFLTPQGEVDMHRTREAVLAAQGMEVTFHRAFDRVKHASDALEQIIACGCHRVLTSGLQPTAMEGVPVLAQLVQQAGSRIHILAGSGVNAANVLHIIQATGVKEVHSSCKQGWITDAGLVKQFLNVLK